MMPFEWDDAKNTSNIEKHGVDFVEAREAFFDADRIIFPDMGHSLDEKRYFCLGIVDGRVMTVRFTWRNGRIRIFGAGFWRKGKALYDANSI